MAIPNDGGGLDDLADVDEWFGAIKFVKLEDIKEDRRRRVPLARHVGIAGWSYR